MILPFAEAVIIETAITCDACQTVVRGIAAMELKSRSLRALEELMKAGSAQLFSEDGELLCPNCGKEASTVDVFYGFDEPDTDPIYWDFDRECMAINGISIEDEDQVVEMAGRPFSVADYHRIKLGAEDPASYMLSPGVMCIPHPAEFSLKEDGSIPDFDRAAEMVRRKINEALDGQGETFEDWGPVERVAPWSQHSGYLTWLGDPGRRILKGDLWLVSIVQREAAKEARVRAAERFGFTLGEQDPPGEIRVERDGMTVVLAEKSIVDATINNALTLDEATVWIFTQADMQLECQIETVKLLREKGYEVDISGPESAVVTGYREASAGKTLKVNLQSLVHRYTYDPEGIVSFVHRMVSNVDEISSEVIGAELACGCTPRVTFAVRGAEALIHDKSILAEEVESLTEAAVPPPGSLGPVPIFAAVVQDCQHQLTYVVEGSLKANDMTREEMFVLAEANLRETEFVVGSIALKDVDNRTVAVLYVGQNIATTLLDTDLVRGMVAACPDQVHEGAKEFEVLCLSTDAMLFSDPDADQEAIALQCLELRQRLENSPWNMRPLVMTLALDREGPIAGRFEIGGGGD